MADQPPSPPKQENLWLNLGFNVVLPALLLTKGKAVIADSTVVLIVALAFPVGYFVYDYLRRRKANFLSILGFVSVLVTGGIGLLELSRQWYIIKEAALPATLGLVVLASAATAKPLIKVFVYSPQVFDVDRVQESLRAKGNTARMDALLRRTTVILAASFFFSAVLNYALASYLVRTEPAVDLERFNDEVGRMTAWSYGVILVPSLAILIFTFNYLTKGISRLTGLEMEEALAPHLREKQKQKDEASRSR